MKKLLLGLGTITAVVTPVAAVVACGTRISSENNMETKQMNTIIENLDELDGKKSDIQNSKELYPTLMDVLTPKTIGFQVPKIPEGFKVRYTFFPDPILGRFKATAFVTKGTKTRVSRFDILGFKTNVEVFDNYISFCNKIKNLSGKTSLSKASELSNSYLVNKAAGGLIPSKPEDMGFISPKLPPEVESISYSLEVSYIPGTINVGAIIVPSKQTMMAGGNLVQEHFTLTGFGSKPGVTYLY